MENPDGTYTDYSVKSYADPSEFAHAVASHPNSHHYIINHDLYTQLSQDGLLQSYADNGIDIQDGGYLHADLQAQATDALDNIHQAADVGHHIPYIGLVMLGIRSFHNIRRFKKRAK